MISALAKKGVSISSSSSFNEIIESISAIKTKPIQLSSSTTYTVPADISTLIIVAEAAVVININGRGGCTVFIKKNGTIISSRETGWIGDRGQENTYRIATSALTSVSAGDVITITYDHGDRTHSCSITYARIYGC